MSQKSQNISFKRIHNCIIVRRIKISIKPLKKPHFPFLQINFRFAVLRYNRYDFFKKAEITEDEREYIHVRGLPSVTTFRGKNYSIKYIENLRLY